MSSGNAFRDGVHPSAVTTPSLTNGNKGHSEHAQKRLKLSTQEATIYTKAGDIDTSLEVDHMILDYLSYQATNAVLANRRPTHAHGPVMERKIAMIDSFSEMFKAKHPQYTPDPELRFRLLLLKFTTLFCLRLVHSAIAPSSPALQQLRESNKSRAREWIGGIDAVPSLKYDMSRFETELPLPLEDLERNRAHVLNTLKMPAEDEAYDKAFYGTTASAALLDMLPSFMTVIAARNELNNSTLNKALMKLAGQFMLQACLEQYLVRGASGSDATDEAFAWGYKDTNCTQEEEVGQIWLNGNASFEPLDETVRMFQHEDVTDGNVQESSDWIETKSAYIATLVKESHGSADLVDHLERLAEEYPIDEFDSTMLGLLGSLADSLPAPVFVQLEQGSLGDMTPAETKSFLQSCGLDSQWPFVSED